MDAIMENKTSYGLVEMRGNKLASIWPLGLDRADIGGADNIEGNLNHMIHMNIGDARTKINNHGPMTGLDRRSGPGCGPSSDFLFLRLPPCPEIRSFLHKLKVFAPGIAESFNMIHIKERHYRLPHDCYSIYKYLGNIKHNNRILTTAGSFLTALKQKTYKNESGIQLEYPKVWIILYDSSRLYNIGYII